MPVIASQCGGLYFAAMTAVILRALTVVALMLMPFGMGAATAAPAHHAPAAATAEHCDDHGDQSNEASRHDGMECAITCSMLMVAEFRVEEPTPTLRAGAARAVSQRNSGLHPDPATPPPKFS